MLYNCIVDIYVLIFGEKTDSKILSSINKQLLKLTSISIITWKQRQRFDIYNKNMNCNGDASRHVNKKDYIRWWSWNNLGINVKTPSGLRLGN